MPSSVQLADGLRLEVYFPALIQGGVGLLRLTGGGIDSAHFTFRSETQAFFQRPGDAWYALVVAHMNTRPRDYPLTVSVERAGEIVTLSRELRVEPAGHIAQNISLPGERVYLIDPDIEAEEFARIADIVRGSEMTPQWDATGFELPLDSALTTPFGAFRVFNQSLETRHTGWDQGAAEGTPIRAMAAGAVAFAGRLPIRGDAVIIDHGCGVFSAYAHFSQLHVAAGQPVAAGQIIGASGNTGRSSAPHLHWEIIVHGKWVDGLAFLDLWLPA